MEWLKDFVTKRYVDILPGLASVIAILESIGSSVKAEPSNESSVAWVYLCLCGFGIYVIGNRWDPILFDPLFSIQPKDASRSKRMWWGVLWLFRWLVSLLPPAKALEQARKTAGTKLNHDRAAQKDFSGLHKTAARLASAQDWKEKIEPLLENSKMARSFLIPLLLLAIYRYNFSQRAVAVSTGVHPQGDVALAM